MVGQPHPAPASDAQQPSGSDNQAIAVLEKLKAFDKKVQRVEVGVCVGALGVMVVLAFLQVFLRQVSGVRLGGLTLPQPVAWFDLVARYMVIWVGVLGASLATAEGRHISIEAAPKLLGAGGRRRLEVLVDAVSLIITALLMVLSLVYLIKIRVPEKLPLFTLELLSLKVFSWWLLSVVPVALGLICWRFGLRFAEGLVYDDARHAELRLEATEREVYELEAKVQEDEEVDLLVEVMRASGVHNAPTDEEARQEVRAALHSDRNTVETIREQLALSGSGLRNIDDLSASESSDDEIPLPDPEPQPTRRRGPVSFKSTDEIPVYTDLSDDDDLKDPEHRHGGPPVLDSSDELDSVSGMEDLLSAAKDELRAEAASTARMEPVSEDDTEESDEVPVRDTTARIDVELPATSSDMQTSSDEAASSDGADNADTPDGEER